MTSTTSTPITGAHFYRYSLPVNWPHSETFHRQGLLLRLISKDREGWGEIAPLSGFSRETLDEAKTQAISLRQRLLGDGVASVESIAEELLPSVRFGVESALNDLEPERSTLSIPINALLNAHAPDVLQTAKRLFDLGYRTFKVKTGHQDLKADIHIILQLVDLMGDSVSLRIDSNRAWTLDEAITFAEATNHVAIEYFEEPLLGNFGLSGLQTFYERTGAMIALDESLREHPLQEFEDLPGIAAYIIKPMLQGGWDASIRLAKSARRLDRLAIISSTFESGVGTAALIRLTNQMTSRITHNVSAATPMGLDPYRLLTEDVISPRLKIEDGRIFLEGNFDIRWKNLEEVVA